VLPQPIQFGKYTLFERIGRGGMADVFKGRVQGPAGFERVFVVKRILPHLSDDPQFTRMFIEEAKLSARLNHPNIVQVFELGAVDKEYFIAMEHVKGRDLAETMRTLWARVGPPRPELVAYVGREMCRALAYAHDLIGDDGESLGMIHRDVSPSNVMLSYEGAVKLLDFGIAKALGGEEIEEGNTQRGTLKGKFAYMAPEQTQGNDVDKRIDIFATGIVLHEVLTGRRLFKGENDLQTVERVRVCEVAPPSMHNPLCPPELDGIILRSLARNRDERFQSSSEMADALDDVVHAARFQPTHLAMLMRELFPTDAGGTGITRMPGSMPGSQSRPHSTLRSPTVPPLSIPRSPPPTRPSLPRLGHVPTPPPRRSFLARGSTWGALCLLVLGVGVGAMVNRTSTREVNGSVPASESNGQPKKFSIKVSSIPDGAKIYVYGENRYLGTTDRYLQFEIKDDKRPSLLFRKDGYHDEIKEVNPYSILIQLRPLDSPPRARGEQEKPPEKNPENREKTEEGPGNDSRPVRHAAQGSGPTWVPTSSPPASPSLDQPAIPTATSTTLGASPSRPAPVRINTSPVPTTPHSTSPPARSGRERERSQRLRHDPNQLANPF
jgi:serine/threonine protein kinase